MSDLFTHLAERALAPQSAVRPRVPSLMEALPADLEPPREVSTENERGLDPRPIAPARAEAERAPLRAQRSSLTPAEPASSRSQPAALQSPVTRESSPDRGVLEAREPSAPVAHETEPRVPISPSPLPRVSRDPNAPPQPPPVRELQMRPIEAPLERTDRIHETPAQPAPERSGQSPVRVEPPSATPPRPNAAYQLPAVRRAESMTRTEAEPAPSRPTVHVSIGRVEVRAVAASPSSATKKPETKRAPAIALDAYLKGGGRK